MYFLHTKSNSEKFKYRFDILQGPYLFGLLN